MSVSHWQVCSAHTYQQVDGIVVTSHPFTSTQLFSSAPAMTAKATKPGVFSRHGKTPQRCLSTLRNDDMQQVSKFRSYNPSNHCVAAQVPLPFHLLTVLAWSGDGRQLNNSLPTFLHLDACVDWALIDSAMKRGADQVLFLMLTVFYFVAERRHYKAVRSD
ncbi:hypothetical protein RRG08_033044 [Elysia crispata]|uniref:Uncharacterized protein n=1 Tax=Elysia crispata TaxID=231223 RepID=A0AAE1A7G0_9GAST|nr:hypothetical protein RRG08_033044 [Elysia crispata]